ncbi:MAG: PAS domain S-box protein [Gallionellaceae bacterium]|jgi:PAS domain S-box-containing protein
MNNMNNALTANPHYSDKQYLHGYAPDGLNNGLVNDQVLHLDDIKRQRNRLRLERTRTDIFNPGSWLGRELASIEDILEKRKHLQAELQRHKIFVATAIDGFWRIDANGVIEEVNEAYAQMSGYTMEELIGMHISQLETNEQTEDVQAHLEKIILQGHDRFETRHRRKDGKIIDLEASTTYLHENKEIFVFFRNITQRKVAEQTLRAITAAFDQACNQLRCACSITPAKPANSPIALSQLLTKIR